MILERTNLVRTEDERPNRRDGTCFYCRAKMGAPHNDGCVVLARTVVVRFEIEAVISVPRDWDSDMVEFRYNDSSYCVDNLLRELGAWAAKQPDDRCSCASVPATFVGEAEASDHAELIDLTPASDA